MCLKIAFADELIGLTPRHELFRKIGEFWVNGKAGGGDKMDDEVFGVFIANSEANGPRPDTGLFQVIAAQFRMCRERWATDNRVGLA